MGDLNLILMPFLQNIISFILEPEFKGFLLFVKIIFIVISVLMFSAIIILNIRSSWLNRFILEDLGEVVTLTPYEAKKSFKKWIKIKQRLWSNKEDEYKLAIIEADSLLGDVLEKMGYKGETMTEKLKQIDSIILNNIEQLKEIRKIRNNIVYDPDYKVSLELAKKILAVYEKSFQELDVF